MRAITIQFLLLLLVNLQTNAQITWQIEDNVVTGRVYHSGDEFSGNTLNEKFWYTGPPYGRAYQHYDGYYSEENIKQENGRLILLAEKKQVYKPIESWLIDTAYLKKNNRIPVNGNYPFDYTLGMLWSKQFYRYGYFECRFKAPEGKGLWPAFWLYGQNSKDEIDFFELKGEQNNKVHLDVHCPHGCDEGYKTGWRKVNWGGWVSIGKYLHDGYNVISGIWKPGEVLWYLNGHAMGKFKGDFATAQSLILNIAVAKDERAFAPGPDSKTVFPAKFEVDYVRVYGRNNDSLRTKVNQFPLTYLKDTLNIIKPAKIKAKKFIFSKKQFPKTSGFVSLYKQKTDLYAIELKGNLPEAYCKIKNKDGVVVQEQKLIYDFNDISLAKLETGEYTFSIEVGKKHKLEEKFLLDKPK